MKGKLSILFVFCIIFTAKLRSQTQEVSTQGWDMTPQPPDVTTFTKYGDYPISYYTGTPQIAIPLFNLKEKDIEIPITLQHSGGAMRVADQSTWVGLGWNLLPGGCITRIVNGNSEDNHNQTYYNALLSHWDSDDELHYLRYNQITYFEYADDEYSIPGGVFTDNIQLMPSGFVPSFLEALSSGGHYFQPDIYSFNFLGYSGKFFYDPISGDPVILEKKANLKIEKDDANWDPEQDGWKITLPSGVIVYFQDIEKIQNVVTGCSNTPTYPSLTWKITKIVLLNGDEINFSYTSTTYQTATISDMDVHSFMDDEDYSHNQTQTDWQYFVLPNSTLYCPYNKHPLAVSNQLKVLTQISSPKYLVTFNRASDTKPKLQSIEYYEKSDPSTKQGYTFTLQEFTKAETYWNQFGTSGTQTGTEAYFKKYKLTELQKYGIKNSVTEYEPAYEFYYNENIGLPSILTFAQDYWGYYNGRHNNEGLIPDESQMYADGGYFPENTLPDRLAVDDLRDRANSNRGVDSAYLVQGSLDKIIFPTGGYTKFKYELHKFDAPIEGSNQYIRMANQILGSPGGYTGQYIADTDAPSKGAGLRIQEINKYDSDNSLIGTKEFEYTNGLLLEPTHFWRIEHIPMIKDVASGDQQTLFLYKVWRATSSNFNQSFALPNTIGYEHVYVYETSGGVSNGYTRYDFYNYETLYNPVISKTSINYLDIRNGLPTHVKYFDSSNNLVKSTDYVYEKVDESMFLSMVFKTINSSTVDKENVFAIEYTPINYELWKEDYVVETLDGVSTTTTFDYSTDGLANLINKETQNSSGETVETSYIYAPDINFQTYSNLSSQSSAINSMVENNILSTPIQVLEKRNGNTVGGSFTEFKELTAGPIVPDKSFSLETTTPLASITTPYVNSSGQLIKSGSFIQNASLDEYDTDGNILEYSTRDGITTSYVWGYNNSLPIAKAVNAASNEIAFTSFENGNSEGGWSFTNYTSTTKFSGNKSHRNNTYNMSKSGLPSGSYIVSFWAKRYSTSSPRVIVNGSTISANTATWTYYEITISGTSVTVDPNNVYIDDLRLRPSDAQMKSYTYDPLYGLSSESDSRSVPAHYIRDELGRLEKILDQDRNVLKQTKYHYK